MTNPIRTTDDDARRTARALMRDARFAALGVLGPDGAPMVTRVGFGLSAQGQPISLVSDLSMHTLALQAQPACSLLIGEPGPRDDPLTHPRLTLRAEAGFLRHGQPGHAEMAAHYLRDHPKAKLYAGFADFSFVRFDVRSGHLNGAFGRAFTLTPADLGLAE